MTILERGKECTVAMNQHGVGYSARQRFFFKKEDHLPEDKRKDACRVPMNLNRVDSKNTASNHLEQKCLY